MTDTAAATPIAPLRVLVYSDDIETRQQVILALGRRPHPDLPELQYVEVATEPVVISNMDAGGIALAILDGEAVPAGGMGIAKQLKDEIYRCPPVLVLTGRPQDAWLATWSRAEAAVSHPIDPVAAGRGGRRAAQVTGAGDRLSRAMTTTWADVLSALVAGHDLSSQQTGWAMGQVLDGAATPAQIAGFAVALRAKGETVDEVTGLSDAMLAAGNPISVPGRLLDVVGTGMDRSMSVNISTMAAIVAAGAGARVVKHGSRSASSTSGSADVLEALGIRLDLPVARVGEGGRGGRHHVLLRGRVPPGHEARRRTPARARHRHHVQLPRPALQPGAARRPGDRLRRPEDGADHGRGVRPPWRRRLGVPR